MIRRFILLLAMLALSGCSFFHVRQSTIEQGNLYTQAEVGQLSLGMTPAQVMGVMGKPVLTNVLTPHELVYVYTYDNHSAPAVKKRVICHFENGRLRRIEND